jgi:hypothetical protein
MLLFVLAVHLWSMNRTIAVGSLFSAEPFYPDDYAVHFARASAVASELWDTGRLWLYDPGAMAGYPLGATLLDLDNVGTAVLMAFLRPLEPAMAFKLIVWLCLALAPVAIWAASRQLGSTPDEAVVAAAGATVVAAAAITFRLGMFANFASGYIAVLVVALAYRHLTEPTLRSFLWLVAVGGGGVLLHVLVGLLVVVPCGLLVVWHAIHRPRRTLVQATAVALAVGALNALWLVPFLRFASVVGSDYEHHFFQTGTLEHALRTLTVLSGWHLFLLCLGVVGFVTWARRVERPTALVYGIWVALLLFVGLQGSRVPLFRRFEPAVFLLPTAFALCPLAGIGAVAVVRRGLGLVGTAARGTALLAPFVFAPHFMITLHTLAVLPPLSTTLPPEGYELIEWIRSRTDHTARIMAEDQFHATQFRSNPVVPDHPYFGSHLLAVLPQLTQRELIGGPYAEMPIHPHRADFANGMFFGKALHAWPPDEFAAQLERYNIGWVVAWSAAAHEYLDAHPAIVEPLGQVGRFRMFGTRHRRSYFLSGAGQLEVQYNRIEVRDASSGGVVLKYHWYPGFCSEPPLPVDPYESPELAAPFIAVGNGTVRHFTLRPTHDWLGRCR